MVPHNVTDILTKIIMVDKIMQITASLSDNLKGRTSLEALTWEMSDISQYLDFRFYDRVWFKEDTGIGETKLGIFLGLSHHGRSLMSYWLLPFSGIPISRTTVQRVTNLESATNKNQKRFEVCNKRVTERYKEEYIREN